MAEFRDRVGRATSSTAFAKALLADWLEPIRPELALAIRSESDWRRNYQQHFYAITKLEIEQPKLPWGELAAQLPSRILLSSGLTLQQAAEQGWASRRPTAYTIIRGVGSVKSIELPTSVSSLNLTTATADALRAFDFIRANNALDISSDILVALAGNAELAATRDWLDWGGTVAVIARGNEPAYTALIEHAKQSAGTLFFVDGGLDLVSDIQKCAEFLRTLSFLDKRIVLAAYGYAPGSNQIKLQAAQIALAQVAMSLPKTKLALAWLATPLDVVSCDKDLVEQQIAANLNRSLATKLRDALLKVKHCEPELIGDEELTGLFDASANRQGPSYLIAKHSERWLALQAMRMGFLTSFTVAPPAATESVIGARRILGRTLKGLTRFGIGHFAAKDTATMMAALMVRNLHDPQAPARQAQSTGRLEAKALAETAIHAGIFTSAYQVDSLWVAASLLG